MKKREKNVTERSGKCQNFQKRATIRQNYPDAFVWKAQAGPYCRRGIPDICCIIGGHFFGFEVKRPEVGRLSKIQEQTILEINRAGGTALVVSYPEQVKEAVDKWQTARKE